MKVLVKSPLQDGKSVYAIGDRADLNDEVARQLVELGVVEPIKSEPKQDKDTK